MKPFWIGIGLSLTAIQALAATFETAGTVQSVDIERNQIEVGDKRYLLPNNVKDSGTPAAGPALFQLRPGMSATFSGQDAKVPIIESLYIQRNEAVLGERP